MIIKERLEKLESIQLRFGTHADEANYGDDANRMCVMEAVAWVAGEVWSDNPKCACPVISQLLRNWNDRIADDDNERTRLLRPLVPLLVGSNSTLAVQAQRRQMIEQWIISVATPMWIGTFPSLEQRVGVLRSEYDFIRGRESLFDLINSRRTLIAVIHTKHIKTIQRWLASYTAVFATSSLPSYTVRDAIVLAMMEDGGFDDADKQARYDETKRKVDESAIALVHQLLEVKE